MSDRSTENTVTEATAETTATTAKKTKTSATAKEPKYKTEKLRANCMKLFSCTQSTFDGALYGHTETELTIAEAEAIINKWLGRKESK